MTKSNLSSILETAEGNTINDGAISSTLEISQEDILLEKSITEVRMQHEVLEGKKQDRKQRGKYANKIFILLCSYLLAVIITLALSGCCVLQFSDAVLITLLSTTTANVIGIFIFVAKYLFHTKD